MAAADEENDAPAAPAGGSQELAEEGAPAWMTTFSDLMSLLLTFFVLMYSMSETKQEKFALARDSLAEAFTGMHPPHPSTPGGPLAPVPAVVAATPAAVSPVTAAAVTDYYLVRIEQRLQELIEERQLQSSLRVERDADGVRLHILSTGLFPSGSAVVEPASRWILSSLGQITASLEVPVVVSGHTDSEPIHTSHFPSNWELSAARAAGVAREIVAQGLPAEGVRVEAFGEHRPAASNASAAERALNRRVEIYFSRESVQQTVEQWIKQGRDAPDRTLPVKPVAAPDSGRTALHFPSPARADGSRPTDTP